MGITQNFKVSTRHTPLLKIQTFLNKKMSNQEYIKELENFRKETSCDILNIDNLYKDLKIPEVPSWEETIRKELEEKKNALNSIQNDHFKVLCENRQNAPIFKEDEPKSTKKNKRKRKHKNKSNKINELILPKVIDSSDSNDIKTENEALARNNTKLENLTKIKDNNQDISDEAIIQAVKTLIQKPTNSCNLPMMLKCTAKLKSKIKILKQESKNCKADDHLQPLKQDSIIQYMNKFKKSKNLTNLSNLSKISSKIKFLQNVLTNYGNESLGYVEAPNFKRNNRKCEISEGSSLNTVSDKEAESIFSDCSDDFDFALGTFSD